MAKEFNTEGKCNPTKHYMADVSGKFAAVKEMIDKGKYFIINRPRQYGKTTTMQHLAKMLAASGEYLVFSLSFEGVGDTPFDNEGAFAKKFLHWLSRNLGEKDASLSQWLSEQSLVVLDMDQLSEAITRLVKKTDKKIVVFIDEVDKSSNNQLFLHFLGMLRDKYLVSDEVPTFHAVVLAGVHDVKNLKIKLSSWKERRPDEEPKLNSPWNIAANFNVDMNLHPFEIKPMLDEYAADKGIEMDTQYIAELLFYHTSGQPFLVSRLCKIFDEDLLPQKPDKIWTEADMDQAVDCLIRENNINFEELTKNIDNNEDLYQLTYRVLVDAEQVPATLSDPSIKLGALYGIFATKGAYLTIHNRVYAEHLSTHLASRLLTSGKGPRDLAQNSGTYAFPDKRLNMEKLLLRFQDLMREEYTKKDRNFLERNGRLVFLAFLKSILNGQGHAFKEPQISEEKRLDIAITFHQHQYVAELKIWRGPKAHDAGILQLVDYLDRQGLDAGYLVIFDHAEVKEWKTQRIRKKGKKIFAVWV